MKVLNKLFALAIVLVLLFTVACGTDEEVDPTPDFEPRLESVEKLYGRGASELRTFLSSSPLDIPVDNIVFDAIMYTIEYHTTYKNEDIVVSGRVYMPEIGEEDVDNSFPMLSFQHGTIAADSEAPSNWALSDAVHVFYFGLAGAGSVVVVPDYIGFGSSVDIVHPYYVEVPTYTAVVDMIRAGGELAIQEGLTLNNDLYLAGYSQGGYATMATHKYLEDKGMEWFELKKSYPASGGYDIIGMRDFFINRTSYDQPFFIAYVAEAYRNYYGWDSNALSLVFQEPYASKIPDLFKGTLNGGSINDSLSFTVSDWVTESFITDPDAATFDFVNDPFEANSLLDWTPTIPMAMYHGDADVWVDYQNSVDVYNHFIENGASDEVVTFTTLEGGDHTSGVGTYIELFLEDLILQVDSGE